MRVMLLCHPQAHEYGGPICFYEAGLLLCYATTNMKYNVSYLLLGCNTSFNTKYFMIFAPQPPFLEKVISLAIEIYTDSLAYLGLI